MQVSNIEWGAIASVLAGAVWLGSLQGSINSLDKGKINENKDLAINEIKKAKDLALNEIKSTPANTKNTPTQKNINIEELIDQQNKKIEGLEIKLTNLIENQTKPFNGNQIVKNSFSDTSKDIVIPYLKTTNKLEFDAHINFDINEKSEYIEFQRYSYIWSKEMIINPKANNINFKFNPSEDKIKSTSGKTYYPELHLYITKNKLNTENTIVKEGFHISIPFSKKEFAIYYNSEKNRSVNKVSSATGHKVIKKGTWNDIKLSINKNKLYLYVNNSEIMNIELENIIEDTYYLGFSSWNGSRFKVKDINI